MTILPTLRLAAIGALTAFTLGQPALRAADHRDGPTNAHDSATDLNDAYLFPDPNNSSNVVLIATFHGFIVPGEAGNEAIFDPVVNYRFEIYNDHINVPRPAADDRAGTRRFLASIKPARIIDVSFSPRVAESDTVALQVPKAQTATAKFTGFRNQTGFPTNARPATFTGLKVLNPSLGATSPDPTAVVETLGTTGISFFAGEVDDPFFFDIPAFGRTVNGIRTGTLPMDFTTNTSFLGRGRDTFAGYNCLAIAFSIPKAAVANEDATLDKIGVNVIAQRHNVQTPQRDGSVKGVGAFKAVDREGNPAINVVLIPFSRKNAYNAASPKIDAGFTFAGDGDPATSPQGIIDILKSLNPAISDNTINTLAGIAVTHGDLLTFDLGSATAGWPNGRKLEDDVVDTALQVIFEDGTGTLGDNVDANDVPFETVFPYLGKTQQPRANGTLDDNTRN